MGMIFLLATFISSFQSHKRALLTNNFRLCGSIIHVYLLVVLVCSFLGSCYVKLDRSMDAEKVYAESVRICKAQYPLGHSALNNGKI